MNDLAALTARTCDEFAMFTRGSNRLIIRGNSYKIEVNVALAKELNVQGYKWSGHTHTGINTIPSDGDMRILGAFDQKRSVIYNSLGNFETFGGE